MSSTPPAQPLLSILAKCLEAHLLVQGFLNDTLPVAHLESLNPQYTVQPDRRQGVKEKVRKSLSVLELALDSHRYVIVVKEHEALFFW